MNKKYVYKRRLLKLADFLESLPKKRFNYESWVGPDWKGAANLSCGTTACALGWATTIPSLRRAGLVLKREGHGDGAGYVTLKSVAEDSYISGPAHAAAEVFGLNGEEFNYLFVPGQWGPIGMDLPEGPGAKATPKQVAKHIRRFVKRQYGK